MKQLPAVTKKSTEMIKAEVQKARDYAREQHAPATRRAYGSDFKIFIKWCQMRELSAIPADPEVVAVFLSSQAQAGVKPATLGRRLAAIRYAHLRAELEPPTGAEVVKATMKGIRRKVGAAPERKAPLTAEKFKLVLEAVPTDTLRGARDRALMLLGFSGALRRSELASLRLEDVQEVEQGLDVQIRRSKTDQEGLGQSVAIPKAHNPWCCPLQALREWRELAGIKEGALFRRLGKGGRVFEQAISAHSIAQMVKRYAKEAGLEAADISAHSLRAGWITSAAEGGASVFKLREVSRHKSLEVLADYVRRADRFKDHAGAGLLG